MNEPLSPSHMPAARVQVTRSIASIVLVLVTLCWGMSFSLMKSWQDEATACPGGAMVAGLTMIALRMGLALLILALVQPRLYVAPSWRAHRSGFLIGLAFFAGFALQVRGLALTTPARSGFLTSLSSAFVPVLAWLWFRAAVAPLTLLGLGVGIAGAGLLSFSGGAGETAATLNPGDLLTIVAALFFTIQVVLVDRLGRTVEPAHMSVSFFGACGLGAAMAATVMVATQGVSLGAWLRWIVEMFQKPHMPAKMAVLVIFCTVFAFHAMNTFQPRVPASRAALIYLLESVFSSAISVALGFDELTAPLLIGGSLILGGNVLAELPVWWREWARTRGKS